MLLFHINNLNYVNVLLFRVDLKIFLEVLRHFSDLPNSLEFLDGSKTFLSYFQKNLSRFFGDSPRLFRDPFDVFSKLFETLSWLGRFFRQDVIDFPIRLESSIFILTSFDTAAVDLTAALLLFSACQVNSDNNIDDVDLLVLLPPPGLV